MEYRYQGRDLFTEPEEYNFASCAADAFLEGWKEHRMQARAALLNRIAGEESAATQANATLSGDTECQPNAGSMSLEALLTKIRGGLSLMPGEREFEEAHIVLNKLVTKFEVFRRLFSHYDGTLKRDPEAVPAAIRHYVLFAETLVDHISKRGETRVLSTLLKLTDAILSRGAEELSIQESKRLLHVLKAELTFVGRWENAVSDHERSALRDAS